MSTCPACGRDCPPGSPCVRCLLATGHGGDGDSTETERIFRIALAYDPAERRDFLKMASGADPALLEELELLLEAYEEEGGDAAAATLGGTLGERWAAVKREEPGTVIDHFRLVKVIGEGGMGSVWEAEQLQPIKRRVALKIIKLGMDTEEVVKRFERERRTLALMAHPHIAQVHEAGATPAGRPYFAMELVDGTAITQHCAQAGLALRDRLALFLEVCAAVEHAHQKGVIHRDLKPSNILVAGGAVKVIDFGIAKATQETSDGLLTREAQVLGTPAYMSPEQAESNGTDVDTRTDVYSLGVVLYELLSGTLPFDPVRLAGTHLVDVQRILREEEPPRPSTRAIPLPKRNTVQSRKPDASPAPQPATSIHPAELRNDLDWIVMKALSKERERRYPSAATFAADVRRFLNGEAVSAVPPTLAYRFGKFVRRNKAAVAAVAGIVLALTAGLIISLHQVQRTNAALAEAETARTDATNTVADMYARSGFVASESDDPTRAALWFANAALIGGKDPERAGANRLRADTWVGSHMSAASAFDTGYGWIGALAWNPRHQALLVQGAGQPKSRTLPTDKAERPSMQIWKLPREERWQPDLIMEAAAWSPSGEWLAIQLPGRVLAVVEYPSGKEVARFPDTFGGSIQWSPDSRWLLFDNLKLLDWRASSPRPVSLACVRSRFSRDGRLLLMQMESTTGTCPVTDPGHFLHEPVPSDPADSAQFLGSGDRYVVRAATGELQVHDSTSGTLLAAYPGAAKAVGSFLTVATSPDGRYVARQNMPALDLHTKTSLALPRNSGPFSALAFSPDSKRLASGGYDNRLELWSLETGEFLGLAGHHHTYIVSAAFSPDGRFLASSEAGIVHVWDTLIPQHVRRISDSDASTRCAISKDGRFMAASGMDNRAVTVTRTRLRRLPDGEPAGPEIAPGGAIMDVIFGPDASWIALSVCTTPDRANETYATGGGTGNIQFWNPHTGERIGEPVPTPSEPRGLCLHPTEPLLGVCCSADGLEIHTATREIRPLFRNDRAQNQSANLNNGRCAYSPDGRIFAAWGTFEYTRLWDRAAGKDVRQPMERETTAFDLDFHGNTVVIPLVAMPMRVQFHSLRAGEFTAPTIPYTGWPVLSQFSEDGTLLLTAGGNHSAQVWDWRAGRLACPALPHKDSCAAALFVPGTPWVITGGGDRKIKFWDRRTGMMIRPPLQCSGTVNALQTTPDARTLIATGDFWGGIELFDLTALLPVPSLEPELLKLRAEIEADAEVHPGGGLAPLSPEAWMKKWRELRAREAK